MLIYNAKLITMDASGVIENGWISTQDGKIMAVGSGIPEHIPEDGVILAPTAFDIESGDTVFDILTEAAQTYGIQVENKGSAGSSHGMVYISGINYIYEFDFGDLSGWVYHVNGITPSRNCGEYVLSDGDRIEWLYTCEVGHDLNEVYEE